MYDVRYCYADNVNLLLVTVFCEVNRDQSYIMAVAPSQHSTPGSASSPTLRSPVQPGSPLQQLVPPASHHRVSTDESVTR